MSSLHDEMRLLRPQNYPTFANGVQQFDNPSGAFTARFNLGDLLMGIEPAQRHQEEFRPTFVAEYRWDQKSPFIFEFQGNNTVRFVRDPEEARMPGHGFIVGSLDMDRDQWHLSFAGDQYVAPAGNIEPADTVSFPNHKGNTVQILRMHYGPQKPVLDAVFSDLVDGETGGHPLEWHFNVENLNHIGRPHDEVYGHITPLYPDHANAFKDKPDVRVPQNDYGQTPFMRRQGFHPHF